MKLRQVQAWFEEAELAAIDKPGLGEKASENDFGIEPLVENLFFNQSCFLLSVLVLGPQASPPDRVEKNQE